MCPSIRLLVVEDEFLSAIELERMVKEIGGEIVGPASTLAKAWELVRNERVDAAVLDVQLDGDTSLALAEELIGRNIPVVLATGFETEMLPEQFAEIPRLAKPFDDATFRRVVQQLLWGDQAGRRRTPAPTTLF